MPIQAPQWTEFLSCPICCHEFDGDERGPISLGCGHTVCRGCLSKLQRNQCPYDQTVMRLDLDQLPVNDALLSLVKSNGESESSNGLIYPPAVPHTNASDYFTSSQCIKELALLLKPFSSSGVNGTSTPVLSRPMQRKLVTLINCQLVEDEGRARSVRAARSLGERTVTELILHHQNHHQLSANLWAAVRSRGCQFLGPAMQEEVLKLVLLALEDGSALSRKVLVMFVVQRLEPHFPQASKTSIGHVVQLLYRASCFKVSKRDGDSSLMQLKEEFRTYEALRREHDAQIVQIATEAGLRIAPDQWSSLLYGDTAHKSHMQSIIDKLQTPQSFGQSVQELVIALQRTGDPGQLSSLRPQLELLAGLDPSPDSAVPSWELCTSAMEAIKNVVIGLVQFVQHHGNKKIVDTHHIHNAKYKTSMCRDLTHRGGCPRGNDCTFAHSEDELEKYRSRSRKPGKPGSGNSGSPRPLINHQQKQNLESSYNRQSTSPHKSNVTSSTNQRGTASEPKKSVHLNHVHANSSHQTTAPSQANNCQASPLTSKAKMAPSHPRHSVKPLNSIEIIRPIMKSADIPIIGKHLVLEEILPPGLGPARTPFEAPKFAQLSPHSQPLPCIPSPNVLRTTLAPTPTPVYATPIPEYAFGTFHPHPPTQIFAAAPTGVGPMHHAAPPPPPGVFPQHPAALLPEIYSPNPQALLLNQGQVYNLVARDFTASVAETRQTNVLAKSLVSSWADSSQDNFSLTQKDNYMRTTEIGNGNEDFSSKSLTELKERKDEILSQLETIVGKEAVDEVAFQIENGEVVSTNKTFLTDYPSTYSIWTSGANLTNFSWGKKPPDGHYDTMRGYRVDCPDEKLGKDDVVPFDPPVSSKFGPISRDANRAFRPSNPIQVSASNTTDPVTTPTVHRPVPAISPMPQVIYQHPAYAVGVISYPPALEFMNTIGHGIIDPPHLHMSQLEPSGIRPSDPIQDYLSIGQEERQRQQFIMAKEGISAFNLNQKFEEMRLKEELNLVLHGIQEKKKEIQEQIVLAEGGTEEDLTEFEQNWNFDFDEGEKE